MTYGRLLPVRCSRAVNFYTVIQKTRHPTRVDNFAKYQSILKILLLLDSALNLLQNDHYISHYILKTLLHYLVKPQYFSYWQVLEQTYCSSEMLTE